MAQVLLAKAVRYPLGSMVVHRSGSTIEVDDSDLDALRGLGVVAEVLGAEPAAEADELDDGAALEDESPDVDDVVTDEESGAAIPANAYPALPDKTAPVAEWKEYARVNDIKLTGLTKRNEIMGYIMKVVAQ